MKIFLYFSLYFILFLHCTKKVEAASLHALLVSDTVGGEFEFTSSVDYMQREVKKISAITGLTLKGLVFEGWQVQIDNILSEISKLTIEPDDVVLVYFTMHGCRSREKISKWPDLIFTINAANYNSYLDFQKVNDLILAKRPRFFLALAESCNTFREKDNTFLADEEDINGENEAISYLPSPSYNKIFFSDIEMNLYNGCTEEDEIDLYHKLFCCEKGSVIVSSSSPGETAIKYPIIGGIFTIKFLESLHRFSFVKNFLGEEFKGNDWELILGLASAMTQEELALKGDFQTPQFDVHLDNFP
ncbi:MAG: caspase family protein [Chlamydiales bacterium]